MWAVAKSYRPPMELARRFSGKLYWNSLELNRTEVLHSVSFKTSHYVDMAGFEMLTGECYYRLKYTVTRGQGVLGKLLTKGKVFVPRSDILMPTKFVQFSSTKRIIPNEWHSIHVLVEMDKFDKSLVTTGGTGGLSVVKTDSGVTVTYGEALETCQRTSIDSGQIGGIAFYTIDPDEAKFLAENIVADIPKPAVTRRDSASMTDVNIETKLPEMPNTWTREKALNPVPRAEYVQAIHVLTGGRLPVPLNIDGTKNDLITAFANPPNVPNLFSQNVLNQSYMSSQHDQIMNQSHLSSQKVGILHDSSNSTPHGTSRILKTTSNVPSSHHTAGSLPAGPAGLNVLRPPFFHKKTK